MAEEVSILLRLRDAYTATLRRANAVTRDFLSLVSQGGVRAGRAFAGVGRAATVATRVIGRGFSAVTRTLNRVRRAVLSLQGAFVAFGALLVGRQLIEFSDTLTRVRSRLRVVTEDFETAERALTRLLDVSQRNRTELEATVTLFSRVAVNRDIIGASLDEIADFTDVVTQSLAIGASTSQEAQGALVQLSQLLAGREIRSAGQEIQAVREQALRLFRVILDGLGLTEQEFRLAIQEGTITTREVLDAIIDSAEELNEEFAKIQPTIGQGFVVLRNSLVLFFGTLLQVSGVATGLFNTLNRVSQFFIDATAVIENFNVVTEDAVETFTSLTKNILSLGNPDNLTAGQQLVQSITSTFREILVPALFNLITNGLVFLVSGINEVLIGSLPGILQLIEVFAEALTAAILRSVEAAAPGVARILGLRSTPTDDAAAQQSFIARASASLSSVASDVRSAAGEEIILALTDVADGFRIIGEAAALTADQVRDLEQGIDDTIAAQVEAEESSRFADAASEGIARALRNLETYESLVRLSAERITLGFLGIADALADVIDGTKSAEEAFTQLTRQLLRDLGVLLVRFAIAQLLISTLFPGGAATVLAINAASGGGFAEGGEIPGTPPASRRKDNVLIRAQSGEFVMRRAAVDHYGSAFMSAINRMMVPRSSVSGFAAMSGSGDRVSFQDGGRVSATQPAVASGSPVAALPANDRTMATLLRGGRNAFLQFARESAPDLGPLIAPYVRGA